ncbi:MAG: thrombospondin type 3 repeat-containing protein [Bacteroidia bacterium]|nr:thrombospondin type 3 repeat-containing protein [Bacteroidia bacterium]
MMGKLSDNEVVGGHNNFESKIAQGDLMAVFHFDNGFILPKTHQTAPYIAAGVSFLSYNTFSDLKDANGNTYNYWRDGSIRNLPEEPANRFSSKIIKRDYTYETNIKKGSTFSIPIALGLAVKLSQNIALCLQQSVYLPMTDEIDNIKNGGNDMYFYTSASLRVSLSGHYKDQNPIYKDVDYLALENTDSDGDGVKDGKDLCPGTPKGVKVDGVGCPLDSDSDGIPDYRDKEPHSKSLNVDENGIALTDESIQKKYGEEVATEEHSAVTELMKKKDQQLASKAKSGTMSKLPAKFAPADLNHDGIITSNEISEAIDSFFVGDSQFTVQKLNDLIDYFFEQ